jgi:hypothetical protein
MSSVSLLRNWFCTSRYRVAYRFEGEDFDGLVNQVSSEYDEELNVHKTIEGYSLPEISDSFLEDDWDE